MLNFASLFLNLNQLPATKKTCKDRASQKYSGLLVLSLVKIVFWIFYVVEPNVGDDLVFLFYTSKEKYKSVNKLHLKFLHSRHDSVVYFC